MLEPFIRKNLDNAQNLENSKDNQVIYVPILEAGRLKK